MTSRDGIAEFQATGRPCCPIPGRRGRTWVRSGPKRLLAHRTGVLGDRAETSGAEESTTA